MARRPKSADAEEEIAEPTGPQPRTTYALTGHAAAEAQILQAWSTSRFHHAWLITGPRGIGKATFAYRVARFLLSDPQAAGDGLFGAPEITSLNVPEQHPASQLVASGAHPGFQLLERTPNPKTGKMRTEIVVDQVRALGDFFGLSHDGAWRVIIIDPAEELNRNAANALLKILEEPPANCCFLLITHAPGRLLPTIRSRCRRIDLLPLSDVDVSHVLTTQGHAATDDVIALSKGSPGYAMRLAGLDIAPMTVAVDRALKGALELADEVSVAEVLASRDSQPRYEAFLELAPERMALAIKAAGLAGVTALEPAFELWEKARSLAAQALAINLDPKLVVLELLGSARQISKYI
jgi:DNA polymerase III subunit delta'